MVLLLLFFCVINLYLYIFSDGISHSGVYCLVDVVLNRICRGGKARPM